MEKVIALFKDLTKNLTERNKANAYMFLPILSLAISENKDYLACLDLLNQQNIRITKGSQFKILTINLEELKRTLEIAEKMGFIIAYLENPSRICVPVEDVIKRISQCEAMGINYHNEKGGYNDFIFDKKLWKGFLNTIPANVKEVVSVPKSITNENSPRDLLNNMKIKNDALRVLEQVGLVEQKNEIFKRIDEISNPDLSEKEILMAAFEYLGGNRSMLSDIIDDILRLETKEKGRAA